MTGSLQKWEQPGQKTQKVAGVGVLRLVGVGVLRLVGRGGP